MGHGKLESDTDADYYRLEITEPGALAVMTNLVDADLTVEIEDGSGASLAKSDRGGARTREGVPNLGVQPGNYIAIVRKKLPPPPKKKKGRRAPPPPPPGPPVAYEITASLIAPVPNAEHEPDDDRGTANDLIAGDTAQGFIGWTNDVDFWKLSIETLSAKNSIDIEIGAVEGVALSLELADGVGQPLLVRKGPRSAPLVVRSVIPVVPSGAPPFHYLAIKGDKSNPETHYTLRVQPKPVEPDQEVEPNDAADKAMVLDLERTRLDGTWTDGDVDYFAIGADVNPRTFDLELTSELDLSLDLLVGDQVIAKSEVAGKGNKEKLSGAVPPNAKAFIRVRPAPKTTGEGTYELTIREGAASGP